MGVEVLSGSPVVLSARDEHCIAVVGRILVLVWRNAPTAEVIGPLEEGFRRCSRGDQSMYVAAAIERAPDMPEQDVRRSMIRLVERYERAIGAMGVAVEVDGMSGMLLRTLVRGMMVATRAPYPTLCTDDVPSLTTWLGAQTDPPAEAQQLMAALDGVREMHRARYPMHPAA